MIGKQPEVIGKIMDIREWNERIDSFIKEENSVIGRTVPVYRIYCQDGTDRSGGGFYNEMVTADTIGRFARALGDSNPLYSDPVYAKEERGGIVAPRPGMLYLLDFYRRQDAAQRDQCLDGGTNERGLYL